MAEDWDLEAVVRGCKSATDTTTTSTAITAAINSSSTAALEEEMSLRDWVKAEAENDPFSFPNLVEHRYNAFQELQQFYMPFYSNPTINNNTTTSYGIIPNPPIISDFGGSSGQHHLQQQQQHHFLPTNATIRPPFNPGTIPVSNFGRFQEQQQQVQQAQQAQQQMLQQNQIQPQNHPQGFAAPILPTMQLHPPRSRKRKSQQKRLVCQVKVENLSADLWAWRKYGQKPIKGSPHPRNYYRCSSTKGCAARKQVERSTTDPDIFIVTYSGDHTHPRPTHRNSLAGSTRNKLSSAATTSSHNKPSNKDFNSSSPLSASSSLSPTAQMTPPLQADQEVDYEEMVMDENENEDEEEDEEEDKDDILIPNNTLMSDDIFMGLHQLETNTSRGTTGTSAANFSNKGQPNLASSWAASHSSSAGATVGGGF